MRVIMRETGTEIFFTFSVYTDWLSFVSGDSCMSDYFDCLLGEAQSILHLSVHSQREREERKRESHEEESRGREDGEREEDRSSETARSHPPRLTRPSRPLARH